MFMIIGRLLLRPKYKKLLFQFIWQAAGAALQEIRCGANAYYTLLQCPKFKVYIMNKNSQFMYVLCMLDVT